METEFEFLTVDEISRRTNIKIEKVRRLVGSGFLPRWPIPGRTIYVRRVDFERAFSQSTDSSGNNEL